MTPVDTVPDRSALFTRSAHHQGNPEQIIASEKDVIRCDYCYKLGHTRDTCFTLHPHLRTQGRGGRGRGSSSGRSSGRGTQYNAHHTTSGDHGDSTTSATEAISSTELTALRQLLSQMETKPPGPSSANSAHKESGVQQNA